MRREELIEEAAKAIREAVWQDDYAALARVAFDVFEKAHTECVCGHRRGDHTSTSECDIWACRCEAFRFKLAPAEVAEWDLPIRLPEVSETLAPGETSACSDCGCPVGSERRLSGEMWCGCDCHPENVEIDPDVCREHEESYSACRCDEPKGEPSDAQALLAIRDDIVRNGGRADAAVLAGIESLAARAAGGVR